jgi:hypothetical protein
MCDVRTFQDEAANPTFEPSPRDSSSSSVVSARPGHSAAIFAAFRDCGGRHRVRSDRHVRASEWGSAHGAGLPLRQRVSFVRAGNESSRSAAIGEIRLDGRHLTTVGRWSPERCSLVNSPREAPRRTERRS